MIDFTKLIVCDNGNVRVIDRMEPGAKVRLMDSSGNTIEYWVSADGTPHADFLCLPGDPFSVSN